MQWGKSKRISDLMTDTIKMVTSNLKELANWEMKIVKLWKYSRLEILQLCFQRSHFLSILSILSMFNIDKITKDSINNSTQCFGNIRKQ